MLGSGLSLPQGFRLTFCQSFTQAGFYYLMSLVVIHLSLAPYAFQSVTSSVGSLLPATEHE